MSDTLWSMRFITVVAEPPFDAPTVATTRVQVNLPVELTVVRIGFVTVYTPWSGFPSSSPSTSIYSSRLHRASAATCETSASTAKVQAPSGSRSEPSAPIAVSTRQGAPIPQGFPLNPALVEEGGVTTYPSSRSAGSCQLSGCWGIW